MNKIASNALTFSDIPEPVAEWQAIIPFCLSFDVCLEPDSNYASLANEKPFSELGIVGLRSSLYHLQRAYAHFGRDPEKPVMNNVMLCLQLLQNEIKNK